MRILRFIKQTFWLDVLILALILLLGACEWEEKPRRGPPQERRLAQSRPLK